MPTPKSKSTHVKNAVHAIQEVRQARRELNDTFKGLPEELTSVKQIIGEDNSTSTGKRLIKAGMTLIVAVPEPFVSDLVGSALVATGFAMDRLSRRGNVREVYEQLLKSMQEIERFRREIR